MADTSRESTPEFSRDPASLGARYIVATLRNAHELASDAMILFEAGRYARAFALGTFAIEEAGKARLTDDRLRYDSTKPFKKDRHEVKIAAARQMLAFAEGVRSGVVNIEDWFSEMHDYDAEDDFFSRMAGLYVDVDDEAGVVGGGAGITAEQAEEAVTLAGLAAHTAMSLMWEANGGGDA
ncbi:AbiV family abortive infection protein [Cellulosimicrobium protaetiae]|uniref:AbiV family abortive infection protein n=1 Tax=Cellulosimicrobium protaetiae TaxID=2587808 RepID=A0A6M5UPA2_9MICO|nr:AbiV family abortive infection protein [Cellulosimicrobium protaetiae]QJW38749.1 AbiV family abortive infection protein [Cellulosimicrobium protaetiae]